MKELYLNRLKSFADYIISISDEMIILDPQLVTFYDAKQQLGYECQYHSWVFLEMPWIHDDWHFEAELPVLTRDLNSDELKWLEIGANPVYKISSLGSPQDPFKAGTISSVLHYYNLSIEGFVHLFGAGQWMQQPLKFGGHAYPKDVTAEIIAENIYQFINTIMKEKYNLLLQFADFLASQEEPQKKEIRKIEMSDILPTGRNTITLDVLFWIFNELPSCFDADDEWYFESHSNEPIFGSPESTSTIESVFSFFNLNNTNEFRELFSVNEIISEKSSLYEVAQNIVDYVKKNRHK